MGLTPWGRASPRILTLPSDSGPIRPSWSTCIPAHSRHNVLAEWVLSLQMFIASGISYNYGKLVNVHRMPVDVFFLKTQFQGPPQSKHSQIADTNHHCPLPWLGQKHHHLEGTEKYISVPFYRPLEKNESKKKLWSGMSQREVWRKGS